MLETFRVCRYQENIFKSACDADDVNIQVRLVQEELLHPPLPSRAGELLSCRKRP
jgi:hypothetical protein